MPIYIYYCKECEGNFETFQKMSDSKITTCETCGCNKKGSVSRVPCLPCVIIDACQPSNMSELAYQNTERMVKEGELPKSALDFESKNEERKKKQQKTYDLGNMTDKQKQDYIYEGKK